MPRMAHGAAPAYIVGPPLAGGLLLLSRYDYPAAAGLLPLSCCRYPAMVILLPLACYRYPATVILLPLACCAGLLPLACRAFLHPALTAKQERAGDRDQFDVVVGVDVEDDDRLVGRVGGGAESDLATDTLEGVGAVELAQGLLQLHWRDARLSAAQGHFAGIE